MRIELIEVDGVISYWVRLQQLAAALEDILDNASNSQEVDREIEALIEQLKNS